MKRLIYICFCHSTLGRSNKPIPVFILMALLCLLLTASAESQTAPRDTTIDGQHYTLHPIETLIAQLGRNAATPITYRHTAFQGRLFATLDTVYAPLDLEDIHFLDEVALNGVVFVAPVHIRQAVFANGLSLQRSRFSADVDFSAGLFHKHATFKEAEFRAGVNFSASRYTAVASFVAADFAGRENRFDRTAFDHAAYFDEAHFSGRADFQDATFADLASFRETVWQQGTSFAGARFGGRALFWDARFAAATTFATARADGETIAINGPLRQVYSLRSGAPRSISENLYRTMLLDAEEAFRGMSWGQGYSANLTSEGLRVRYEVAKTRPGCQTCDTALVIEDEEYDANKWKEEL